MKKNVGLKILIVLIIFVICLISFVGIFSKNKNSSVNLVPEFLLGMNLGGARVVKMAPNSSTKEVIYDAEGKVTDEGTDEEGNLKEGYSKKEELINAKESLTTENYNVVKGILERRLKTLGMEEYILRENKENGEFILELPEGDKTDEIISNLASTGKFEIQDEDTKEVLLKNEDVKQAKVVYGSSSTGTTIYLNIEFTKEGASKLEEISKKYIATYDEEENQTIKKIAIKLDDTTLKTTYFGETITTGLLQLSIGSESTKKEEINSYTNQAMELASIIDGGKMPITYAISNSRYMLVAMGDYTLPILLGIGILLLAISIIYFTIRYKGAGLITGISLIGLLATLLITLRYTNVTISLEAIIAIATIFLINVGFLNRILKQRKESTMDIKYIIYQVYKRELSIIVPLAIIAVTFAFGVWVPIASIGMVMFWGLAITLFYHYIITRTLLLNIDKKIKE